MKPTVLPTPRKAVHIACQFGVRTHTIVNQLPSSIFRLHTIERPFHLFYVTIINSINHPEKYRLRSKYSALLMLGWAPHLSLWKFKAVRSLSIQVLILSKTSLEIWIYQVGGDNIMESFTVSKRTRTHTEACDHMYDGVGEHYMLIKFCQAIALALVRGPS